VIKCVLCDRAFPIVYSTERGKMRNGYDSLMEHIAAKHLPASKGFLSGEQNNEIVDEFLARERVA